MTCAFAARVLLLFGCVAATGGCGDTATPRDKGTHAIYIDIDDHGLGGLWMANAPHLRDLIAHGTLAYSRVIVPTHSNQSNMALLTGQYPEGNDVPANSWLSRSGGYAPAVTLPGLSAGEYALYDTNPLRRRGDSVYQAVHRAGGRSAYVGQLPPFEVGADDVDLPILGLSFGGLTATPPILRTLLSTFLHYPTAVLDNYVFSGPPAMGESQLHFTLREAASYVRKNAAAGKLPALMFVWDFIALDEDPTSAFGADGPELQAVIEDYDAGLGELLAALTETGLRETTNIVFTLDHGKVDTHKQAVLGTHGATAASGTQAAVPADGQLAVLVAGEGPALGIGPEDYALLNEEGDAQLYARVPGAGTEAGTARQGEVTRALLTLVQSGKLPGVDTARTMTADGALGTHRFADVRAASPHQPDILIFPQDDWTLSQVDATNEEPGPFKEHEAHAYGRHGGFSVDELYVPLIMQGPAFKKGMLVPHPVEHADVAATVLAGLAASAASGSSGTNGNTAALTTAARGPLKAALVGQPGETWLLPAAPETSRELVLRASGVGRVPTLAASPATAAVLIDVAGLYNEEIFADSALATEAAPLRALSHEGTRFDAFWMRRRDWPVSQWEALTGSLPMSPYVPTAEDDPAITLAPGLGSLAMPPPPRFVAHPLGYETWRQPGVFGTDSLPSAAAGLGIETVLLSTAEQPDFYGLHVPAGTFHVSEALAPDELTERLDALLSAAPKSLVVVALGGPRTGDRHSAAARAELKSLAELATALAHRAAGAGALVLLTSRGATVIDDPNADAYGPGSSRHVPCLLLGPNVRKDVVSGQPAEAEDIAPTLLFGLGATATSDLARGTFPIAPTGTTADAPPASKLPLPASATVGKVLMRGFVLGDEA